MAQFARSRDKVETPQPLARGSVISIQKSIRAVFGPGEAAPGFFDAVGAVIVSLTPGYFEITSVDGKKAYSRSDFGTATWSPAGRILLKNLSDMNAEFIVIEPKPSM